MYLVFDLTKPNTVRCAIRSELLAELIAAMLFLWTGRFHAHAKLIEGRYEN